MLASEGEILTLRPVGFTPDRVAIESFLQSLPGRHHRPNTVSWSFVAPAADLPRFLAILAGTPPGVFRPGDPQWAEVEILDDRIWVHPGLIPETWARAQNVIIWLLGLGPWRVTGDVPGQDRELGIVRTPSELFDHLYHDPDIPRLDPKNPTESPPRVGELTTFRRYLGDPDTNDYFHEFLRVHDSGAFSFEESTAEDTWRWEGRLTPDLAARWSSLVGQLDFSQSSPGYEDEFEDRVAVIVQRPGEEREKTLDTAHPPESFAALVRLMDGWAQALHADRPVADLTDVRKIA